MLEWGKTVGSIGMKYIMHMRTCILRCQRMNAMYCMCHHKTHLLKLEFYSQWTLGGEDFGKNYMMRVGPSGWYRDPYKKRHRELVPLSLPSAMGWYKEKMATCRPEIGLSQDTFFWLFDLGLQPPELWEINMWWFKPLRLCYSYVTAQAKWGNFSTYLPWKPPTSFSFFIFNFFSSIFFIVLLN